MTGRFEIGRYELASAVSRPGFLRTGVTKVLPEAREAGGGGHVPPQLSHRGRNAPPTLACEFCYMYAFYKCNKWKMHLILPTVLLSFSL